MRSLIILITLILIFYPGVVLSQVFHVEKIIIKGLHLMSEKEFFDILNISLPTNINNYELSKGIKRLFRKGIFKNIEVEYKDSTLIFKIHENEIIKDIIFKGNIEVSDLSLKKVIPYKYGDFYNHKIKATLVKILKSRLSELGFPHASIRIETKKRLPSFVVIICHIKEGSPAIIKRIEIRLDPPVTDVDIVWLKLMMRTEEGGIYNQEVLRSDIQKIRDFLKKKGYLQVHIDRPVFINGVLRIKVHPGIKYLIKFTGVRTFPLKTILREAGLNLLRFYNREEIEAVAYRVKRFYRKQGYIKATVTNTIIVSEKIKKIIFSIQEGPLFKIKHVKIEGGHVPPKIILRRLYLKVNKPFNPYKIKRDISNIKTLYKSLGYRKVKVNWKIVVVDDHYVSLSYKIEPGPLYTIYQIRIFGNDFFSTDYLLKVFKVKKGDSYNAVDLEEGRRAIQRLYQTNGFLDVQVKLTPVFNEQKAYVNIKIIEGQRYSFGKVIVKGNLETDYSIIRTKVPFKEGNYINPERLPEIIRVLYSTGLFSNVNAKFIDAGDAVKDLVIEVDEAPAGTVEFSIGYGEYEKLRGALEIRYLNLFGKNKTGSFRLEMNTLRATTQLSYRDPYFLEPNIELLGRLKFEKENVKNFDTGKIKYRSQRYSATVGLQRAFTKRFTGSVSYEYTIVRTYDISADVVLSEKDKGYLGIESLIIGLTYDRRDNPFNPTHGFITGVSIKNASSYLLGQTDFVKIIGSLAAYFKLYSYAVLAVGTKGGIAFGYKDTNELPIVERFFLGGRNSVRGFAQDALGPKGPDGNPTGGNAFAQINMELRLKVFNGLGLVGFVDGGNVWKTVNEMRTKLRYAAGIGLRYNTPAGPIRIDYGWKLEVKPGESAGEFHFSIGHAF